MSEIRLQSDIAQEFSVRFPKLKGQFFHVSNERNNKIQAYQALSIGIVRGVSDFIFFKKSVFNGLYLLGIEVKEPESYHEVAHIQNQLKWGKKLEECGGHYYIVRSVSEVIDLISTGETSALRIADVEKMISENGKKKTLRF